MYQLSSERKIAIPLAAQPVEPLVQQAERIASFIAGAGRDFARGVVKQGIGMAIIGVNQVGIGGHGSSLQYVKSQDGIFQPRYTYYTTKRPKSQPLLRKSDPLHLDVRRLNRSADV